MTATVATVAYLRLEARAVEVQVQLSAGLPRFTVVDLPDKAVAESRERVRAALSSIGLALPPKVINVNLSPAELPKEGSHYDVPIALGLLAAIGRRTLRPCRNMSSWASSANGHGPRTNAEADGELLDRVATPDDFGRKLLANAAAAMRLSARGFHRVLPVSRTIADLAGAERSAGSISLRRSATDGRRCGTSRLLPCAARR